MSVIYIYFFKNHATDEMMWKNDVEWDKPQMTIWLIPMASWITKATDTCSLYVILIVFPLQQWLHEHTSELHYAYNVYQVFDFLSF
jgi:hypothetical protein